MPKSTIKERLTQFFGSLVPVNKRTIYDVRQMPSTIATSLDVDRVHSIFLEAQSGNIRDLFALYRDILLADNHLQAEFSTRKLAVLGDVFAVQPADKTQPADVAAAKGFESAIKAVPGWLNALSFLLDSVLWPVSIVEKVYAPLPGGGFRLTKLVPVPYELLDYSLGFLRLWDTDPDSGIPLGTAQIPDPFRYIIHRGHLLSTPDNWGGPMRSLVFWWLLGAMDRDWWSRFLDRYGSPFIVGKYDQGDDTSRSILERAFRCAVNIGGLVVTRDTEVELIQAAAGNSGEAYDKFLQICQREKSKLILGQAASEQRSSGLGSGISKQQEGVRQDFRQWDALCLATTLREQLAAQWMQINSIPGGSPRLVWGGESSESQQAIGTLLQSLAQAGLQLTDDAIAVLGERLGMSLQRAPSTAGPTSPASGALPLSAGLIPLATTLDAHIAQDDIARAGAADLARAFRGSLAPVRRLIALSRSPQELEANLRTFYPDFSPGKTAELIEQALIAYTASGAAGGIETTK